MQIIKFTFAISSLVALLARAAPISLVDGSDDFEARDEDVELWRRVRFRGDGLMPVGPGVRHPEDAGGARFHPMPSGHYVQAHDNVYSHRQVNAAAHRLIHEAIPQAHTYTSNRQRTGARTYPKASSGFRKTEHAHDPAHGYDLAYHYPMTGKPGPAPRNPRTGRVSMQVGTDRVMAWRNRADSHYNIGVSHHDHTRPKPETSNNHPFSHAAPKKGSVFKVGALKAKSAYKSFKGIFKKKKKS